MIDDDNEDKDNATGKRPRDVIQHLLGIMYVFLYLLVSFLLLLTHFIDIALILQHTTPFFDDDDCKDDDDRR